MNVSDIITIVANQSLDSDTPDAEDKARLLRYLNQAYLYILQEINAQSNEQGEFSQTIDVVGGQYVMTFDKPARFVRVVDVANERELTEATLGDILTIDPDLSRTDECPIYYYITNRNEFNVYPICNTQCKIVGVADPNALTEESTSDDIRIPTLYQNILIPATLKWVYADERDATASAMIRDNEITLEDRLNMLKQFMYRTTKPKTPNYPFA
tara:strand:+ start:6988 stop:7626 length:639 start_codon:yes stop_codon:yes gene_type:complete